MGFLNILREVCHGKPSPGEPLLEVVVSDAELNGIFDPIYDWQLPFVEVIEDNSVIGETKVCRDPETGHPTRETCLTPRWNQRFIFRASGACFYRFQVCIEHFVRCRTVVGECGFAACDAWAVAASMGGPVALSTQILRRGKVTGKLNLVISMHDPHHEAHAIHEVRAAQHKAKEKIEENPAIHREERDKVLSQFYQYNWAHHDMVKQGTGSALYLARPVSGHDKHQHRAGHDVIDADSGRPPLALADWGDSKEAAFEDQQDSSARLEESFRSYDAEEYETDERANHHELMGAVWQEMMHGETHLEAYREDIHQLKGPEEEFSNTPFPVRSDMIDLDLKSSKELQGGTSYGALPYNNTPFATSPLSLGPGQRPLPASRIVSSMNEYTPPGTTSLGSARRPTPPGSTSLGSPRRPLGTAASMGPAVFSSGRSDVEFARGTASMGPAVFSVPTSTAAFPPPTSSRPASMPASMPATPTKVGVSPGVAQTNYMSPMGTFREVSAVPVDTIQAQPLGKHTSYSPPYAMTSLSKVQQELIPETPTAQGSSVDLLSFGVSEEERQRRRDLTADRAQFRQDQSFARGIGDVGKANRMLAQSQQA